MSRFTDRLVSSLLLVLFLLAAMFARAADRHRFAPEGTFIATTGRIMMIDLKNKTLRVRASDNHVPGRRDDPLPSANGKASFPSQQHYTEPEPVRGRDHQQDCDSGRG